MPKVIYQSLVVVVLVNTLNACVSTPDIGDKTLLDFLQPDVTDKVEVLKELGQPTGGFVEESILTYRIGHFDDQGYFLREGPQIVSGHPSWRGVNYSLVLIFDESNVLQEYRLVEVQ